MDGCQFPTNLRQLAKNLILKGHHISSMKLMKQPTDTTLLAIEELIKEKDLIENLLSLLLPKQVLDEFKSKGKISHQKHPEVSVVFCDLIDFTPYCESHSEEEIVQVLSAFTCCAEELAKKNFLTKIKTVGDSVLCASGLFENIAIENTALNSVRFGLEMIEETKRVLPDMKGLRVDISTGPVIAGVIGHTNFSFDIWGDTVNFASRLQQCAPKNSVNVCSRVWEKMGENVGHWQSNHCQIKGKSTLQHTFVIHSLLGE